MIFLQLVILATQLWLLYLQRRVPDYGPPLPVQLPDGRWIVPLGWDAKKSFEYRIINGVP